MPFDLSWEPRGVYRRYFGDVTAAERRRSFEQISGDVRFDTLRYSITDYLAVGQYEITDDNTVEIAALHIAPLLTNPAIVVAAVAVDERVVAAIEHFIALGLTPQPYRVFATVTAAREWIDVQRLQSLHPVPRLRR
jgi:hypothetical protein